MSGTLPSLLPAQLTVVLTIWSKATSFTRRGWRQKQETWVPLSSEDRGEAVPLPIFLLRRLRPAEVKGNLSKVAGPPRV